jgi:hypothetical protein
MTRLPQKSHTKQAPAAQEHEQYLVVLERFTTWCGASGLPVKWAISRALDQWMRARRRHRRKPRSSPRDVAMRVKRAELLVSGSDRPMKEIAAATGFPNRRAFEVIFRYHTGLTPTQYREKWRADQ